MTLPVFTKSHPVVTLPAAKTVTGVFGVTIAAVVGAVKVTGLGLATGQGPAVKLPSVLGQVMTTVPALPSRVAYELATD
jgi:hypothetical protein